MKNKIVTLLCIMTILITTGIVAAQGRTADRFVTLADGEKVIIQHLNDKDFPPNNDIKDVLVPGVNVDKKVTVKNVSGTASSQSASLYVRTTFAFEAGDVRSTDIYDDYMHIEFNNTLADASTPYWSYPDFDRWKLISIKGEQYYMVTAKYYKQLESGDTTEPSLLNVGLESNVTSDMASQFGDEFKMYVYSEASAVNEFGDYTSDYHPWLNLN